jgi:serine/threonine protein phosphatase PrpC
LNIDASILPPSRAGELQVETGLSTSIGSRERNEDYAGIYLAPAEQRPLWGIVAAVADGVSAGRGSRVAAELAVRGFIDGYLGDRVSRGVKQIVLRSVEAIDSWIRAQSQTDLNLAGMSTTLSALVLRGRTAHVVHIGDSRIYRLRQGELTLLTQDHVVNAFESRHILTRCVGGQSPSTIDFAEEALQVGDRFLLCTDGVHGVLNNRTLASGLRSDAPVGKIAQSLTAAALSLAGSDNATAIVVDITSLPEARLADVESAIAALPIGRTPKLADVIDGLRMERLIADGFYTRVFKATDLAQQARVFVKFPKERVISDAVMRQAFLREGWICSLVRSPYVGEALQRDRSQIYTAMPWYEGETLESRLQRPPKISATFGLGVAQQLIKGVAALHRAGFIHRDIKPDNVILLADGGIRLIDLGVARAAHLDDFPEDVAPGTPNYMAPELYAGGLGNEQSDIFALGVTLFRMFTGGYPYAEIDSGARPSFRRSAPLTKLRPDLPGWLGPLLARACAFHPQDRQGDAIELLFDLEHGQLAGQTRQALSPAPLYERHPLLIWKVLSAALALALVISLLTRSPPGARVETPPNRSPQILK